METYYGQVRAPADAIKLFEACRLGLLPRVQRRLSEKERQCIKSGSVFVWDEREAGMRRWTDGKSWSASRVSGSFLTYREMEGKRGGTSFPTAPPLPRRIGERTPASEGWSEGDQDMDGEGQDGYRYKADGLMKQSFSITTTNGQHLHLISYYSRPGPNSPDLKQPSTDPALRHIVPVKGLYPESTMHETRGPSLTHTPIQQQGPYTQSPQSNHMQMQGSPSPRQLSYSHQLGPAYGWSPTLASVPPYQHHPGTMYQYPGLPSPSPSGPQHTSYPPTQYIPHQQLHQHHYPQSPMPPAYPQQHIHHQHSQNDDLSPLPYPQQLQMQPHRSMPPHQNSQYMIPTYAATTSPQMTHARVIAEQQALAKKALQNAQAMIDPRLTNPTHASQPPTLASGKPERNEEQLTASPPQNYSLANAHSPSPKLAPSINDADGSTVTHAQSVPNISNLVHANDSVSVLSDIKSNSRSSSPGSGKGSQDENQVPTNIPHDKINILGEDKRAIRVLDRKFCI